MQKTPIANGGNLSDVQNLHIALKVISQNQGSLRWCYEKTEDGFIKAIKGYFSKSDVQKTPVTQGIYLHPCFKSTFVQIQ